MDTTKILKPENMRWGMYQNYEGCYHLGNIRVEYPSQNADFSEKVVCFAAKAEGGNWNAVNMYDSGFLSVGAIQWIDAAPQMSVTGMLANVVKECGEESLRKVLQPALDISGADFVYSQEEQKFRFTKEKRIVETKDLQKILYFGDTLGNQKGSFTAQKKQICKVWGSCMANVWLLDGAIKAQKDFTYSKINKQFLYGKAKTDLMAEGLSSDGWEGMIRAAVVSYAVNIPAVANRKYETAAKNSKNEMFSPQWCLDVLYELVVVAQVKLWTHRYTAQREAAEKLFGVQLPTVQELISRSWTRDEKFSNKRKIQIDLKKSEPVLDVSFYEQSIKNIDNFEEIPKETMPVTMQKEEKETNIVKVTEQSLNVKQTKFPTKMIFAFLAFGTTAIVYIFEWLKHLFKH